MCYWNLTGHYERDGKVRLSGPCVVTGKRYSVLVSREGARNYFEGLALAQEAFPELPKEGREFLISGVSPQGWKQLFKDDSQSVAGAPSVNAGSRALSENSGESQNGA